MSSLPPRDANSANSGRLNGWKEISAYLQKSVRTVQRWEKDLQLPVHRIHGNGGEIIFANKEEIEAWLHGTRVERLHDARENESGEHAVAPRRTDLAAPVPSAPQVSRHWRWVAIASMAALLIFAAALLVTREPAEMPQAAGSLPKAGAVAGWKIEGGALWALDANKRQLWPFRTDPPLTDDSYKQTEIHDKQVVIADLDGDGPKEIVFIAITKDTTTLHVLEATGAQRFAYVPQHRMKFGSKPQGPPWPLDGVSVVRNPDGTGDIWLRTRHNLWYPSALIRLERTKGKALSTYWSSGHITFEREATLNGRRVMFVGATSNDSKGASLAVLDYNNANGYSPVVNTEYGCDNCDSGGLLQFLLFPQTELSRAIQSRPNVIFVRLDADRNPLVDVTQGRTKLPDNSAVEGTAFYALTSDLHVSEAETGDSYRQAHALLEMTGTIKHAFNIECEKQLFPVLRWNGKEFVAETGTLGSPPRANRSVVAGKTDKTRLSPAALRR